MATPWQLLKRQLLAIIIPYRPRALFSRYLIFTVFTVVL